MASHQGNDVTSRARQPSQDPELQHDDDGDRRARAVQDRGPLRAEQMAPARRRRWRVGVPVLQHVGHDDGGGHADRHFERPVEGHVERLQRVVQAHQQHHARGDREEQPGEPVRAHLHGDHAQHRRRGKEQVERKVVVGQPPRHHEAQHRTGDRSSEPQHAAAQRAGAGRHQRHEPADRRPPRRFDFEHKCQRGRQHDRAGRDNALPRAHRILAQLAELPPVACERLLDHVAHLGKIRDDRPGELPHHRKIPPRGKITVRASAPI